MNDHIFIKACVHLLLRYCNWVLEGNLHRNFGSSSLFFFFRFFFFFFFQLVLHLRPLFSFLWRRSFPLPWKLACSFGYATCQKGLHDLKSMILLSQFAMAAQAIPALMRASCRTYVPPLLGLSPSPSASWRSQVSWNCLTASRGAGVRQNLEYTSWAKLTLSFPAF